MKSITQFFAVSLMSAVVSGCICLMPMEKMDRGKDHMGQMDRGDKGQSHEMAGTKIEKTKVEKRVWDLMVAFATIPQKPTTGENVLRVKLTAASGETIKDAVVSFTVTMAMPGMTATEESATLTKRLLPSEREL
jgi:YtkA-like